MSKLTITINMDSAAFDDNPELEVARILQGVSKDIASGKLDDAMMAIRDLNGNTVGYIESDEE